MVCDLCSKKAPTAKYRIEGVVYDACHECGKLGTKVQKATLPSKRRSRRNPDEDVTVRSDVGERLRKARGSKTHKEFAKELRVKESDLHAWETGHRTPTIDTARRIQRQIHVSLLTQIESVGDTTEMSSSDSGALTIGDLLKKK